MNFEDDEETSLNFYVYCAATIIAARRDTIGSLSSEALRRVGFATLLTFTKAKIDSYLINQFWVVHLSKTAVSALPRSTVTSMLSTNEKK